MSAHDDDLVRSAYRLSADEMPSAGVDDAIRAAARRAVHARPRPIARMWFKPIAAAAVLVLGLTVVLVAQREPTVYAPPAAPAAESAVEPTAADAQSTLGASTAPSKDVARAEGLLKREADVPSPAALSTIAPPKPAAKPSPSARDAMSESASGSASSPAPPPPPPPPAEMEMRSSEVMAEAPLKAEPAAAAPPPQRAPEAFPAAQRDNVVAPKEDAERKQIDSPLDEINLSGSRLRQAPQMAPVQSMMEPSPTDMADKQHPVQWLETLRALKASGDMPAFEAELKRFRQAWPNYPVPADW